MDVKFLNVCGCALGLVFGMGGGTAAAAGSGESPFSLDATATLASEYVFRGISQSNQHPAVQGSLVVSHESGLYALAWGSSGRFNNGAGSLEVDYIAGYATDVSGLLLDASVIYYTYPGDERKGDYVELMGKVGYDFGRAIITGGVGYVPSGQTAYGDNDAVYLFSDVQVPLPNTAVTAVFHVGYEDFGRGRDKLDWSAGLAFRVHGLDLGVTYLDTDLKANELADSRLLFTVSKSF